MITFLLEDIINKKKKKNWRTPLTRNYIVMVTEVTVKGFLKFRLVPSPFPNLKSPSLN